MSYLQKHVDLKYSDVIIGHGVHVLAATVRLCYYDFYLRNAVTSPEAAEKSNATTFCP